MEIKTKDELNAIILKNRDNIIIVRFHASWCTPCKVLGETIDSLDPKFIEGVEFFEVDVDEVDESFIEEFNIRSIPVLLFYKDGLLADRTVGLLTKDNLINKITEVKNK